MNEAERYFAIPENERCKGERELERDSSRGGDNIQQTKANANRIKCKQIAIELMKIY